MHEEKEEKETKGDDALQSQEQETKEQEGIISEAGTASSPGGSEDDIQYPTGIRLLLLTMGLMTVVLMVALDNYILATAIPMISTQFHSLNDVGWYASAYFLTQMAFQPTFGHLFTDLSPRNVFLGAVLLFEVGSIICATAPNTVALIMGRLIAGAGGGGLYVGTLTFMGLAVPIRKRPFYISIVTMMFGVASIAGPLLGGVFTDSAKLTWRFCFWINLPIGFVAVVLIASFQAPPRLSKGPKISALGLLWKLDPVGLTFLIAGFVCFLLAFQWAGLTYPWDHSRIWGCLLGFALLTFAFLLKQIYFRDSASVPLHIIRQRTVAAGSLFILFINGIVGLLIYYLPLYFQAAKGASARESGIRNLPFLVTMLFAPIISGALIGFIGFYVPFMYLGSIFATIGSGLLFTLEVGSGKGIVSGYQFLTGLGLGLCTQISFNAVQYVLPQEQMAMGSSLVSFCNSLGPILGTNIGQTIFVNMFIKRLNRAPGVNAHAVIEAGPTSAAAIAAQGSDVVREAFNFALTRAFVVAIAFGVGAFISSLFMEWGNVKHPRIRGPSEDY